MNLGFIDIGNIDDATVTCGTGENCPLRGVTPP
jgi:hypothetical protein